MDQKEVECKAFLLHTDSRRRENTIKLSQAGAAVHLFTVQEIAMTLDEAAQKRQAAFVMLYTEGLDAQLKQFQDLLFGFFRDSASGLITGIFADVMEFSPVWLGSIPNLPAPFQGGFEWTEDLAAALIQHISESITGPEPRLGPEVYDVLSLEVPEEVTVYQQFIQMHRSQFEAMKLPSTLWKSVYFKLVQQIFDAGNVFSLMFDPNHGFRVVAKEDLNASEDVWLVDHAWTTKPELAKQQLQQFPPLVDRLYSMMALDGGESVLGQPQSEEEAEAADTLVEQTGVSRFTALKVFRDSDCDLIESLVICQRKAAEEKDADESEEAKAEKKIERVLAEFWRYASFYKVLDPTEAGKVETVWFLTDEVGTAISHDEAGNSCCFPLICLTFPGNPAFNLLWLNQSVQEGDYITRNTYPTLTRSEEERSPHVWLRDQEEARANHFVELFQAHQQALTQKAESRAQIASDQVFNLRLPPSEEELSQMVAEPRPKLSVYTDLEVLTTALSPDWFEIVDEIKAADIVWFAHKDFKEFNILRAGQFVNKFPHEACLTYKHFLHQTLENYYGTIPWKPITYNSKTQICEFTGDYLTRQQEHQDNTWITKSANSTHSVGHTITQNVAQIIRLSEAEPIIIQKYIDRPLTFSGRKFDLRFIVLVRSVEPLQLFVYNTFWIRLSNKQFEMKGFEDYETHFTVMNYSQFQMTQIWYYDFVSQLQSQYPEMDWSVVQTKIYRMIRQIFVAASDTPAPAGFAHKPESRAMYGLDVMIDQEFNPSILEVNFSPDCKRAVNYHPRYFNHVFSVLFHDDISAEALRMVTEI
eukprot:TRINITY_DN4059_c0_g1_i11.p1 TRINITY_DN4059_c0_g1~~TRINITY_DN4059_c0_g1_i11.p1  ORF type:complete len:856 (+),score=223.63 TRINITY_DN4059_c0_g1_i11:130-2568(+)